MEKKILIGNLFKRIAEVQSGTWLQRNLAMGGVR